jgi:hypothetical protein
MSFKAAGMVTASIFVQTLSCMKFKYLLTCACDGDNVFTNIPLSSAALACDVDDTANFFLLGRSVCARGIDVGLVRTAVDIREKLADLLLVW